MVRMAIFVLCVDFFISSHLQKANSGFQIKVRHFLIWWSVHDYSLLFNCCRMNLNLWLPWSIIGSSSSSASAVTLSFHALNNSLIVWERLEGEGSILIESDITLTNHIRESGEPSGEFWADTCNQCSLSNREI